MSNSFEKFIQKNRKEFDSETPSDNVWAHIAKTIPAGKDAKRFSIRDIYKWSAAAAILFIILTSIYFLYIRKYSHETNPIVNKQNPVQTDPIVPIDGITPEYAVQFKTIYESVENRQEELKTVSTDQPQLYKQFEEDLKVLDSAFIALKNQATHTPNRDVLIKAMIQNLQLQAELLGRQLLIIKEVKKPQIQKNEKYS